MALSWLPLALLLHALPLKAAASQVTGLVLDEEGKAVEAVVWIDAKGGEKTKNPAPVVLRQHDKAFEPRMEIAEIGQLVRFPNEDQLFHNVFSASKGNAFDLGLYKADGKYDEKTRAKIEKGPGAGEVRFKEPGRVDIYCNIHPAMGATLIVLPHAFHARTGPGGTFVLKRPAGDPRALSVHAIDALGNEAVAPLSDFTGAAPGKLAFKSRRTDVQVHTNKEGQPYKTIESGTSY